MNWFRKHVKTGSRLALFALAIQFALSFGHFHAVAAPAVQTSADLAITAALATLGTDSEAAQDQQPSDHNNDIDHQPANACAICAVLSLANHFLSASPPLLELPRAVEFLYLTTDAEFAHLGSLHPPFRSRAPPAS